MRKISHRHVIGVKDVFATASSIFLVMEFVDGGELFEKIASEGRQSEEQAAIYMRQLLEGLECCHREGVCHRDLKPEVSSSCFNLHFTYLILTWVYLFWTHSIYQNLLLDSNGDLKISDFGLATLYVGDVEGGGDERIKVLETTCGTPNYVAPEVLKRGGYNGQQADVWSVGVILFVILAGFLPFEEASTAALFQKILSASYDTPAHFSPSVRHLLSRILVTDPSQRITIEGIKHHPWITGSPFNADEAHALFDAPTSVFTGSALAAARSALHVSGSGCQGVVGEVIGDDVSDLPVSQALDLKDRVGADVAGLGAQLDGASLEDGT